MSTTNSTPKPILEALQNALASGPAQKLNDGLYNPRPQNYWIYNGTTWTSSSSASSTPPPTQAQTPANPKAVRLFSWNIDMLQPNGEARMARAIQHLHTLITSTPPSTPTIIFLQEMVASDLAQLRRTPWIQERFHMTELDGSANWQTSWYGTTTLVDRRLAIAGVFRVPWISNFGRDGLFVDIELATPSRARNDDDDEQGGEEEKSNDKKTLLRLCNTHLESLVADPPIRPSQLAAASSYLHPSPSSSSSTSCTSPTPTIAAALLAGDLNAIEPFDLTLASTHGLHDLYLTLGGQEHSDDGYTWGYQVPAAVRRKYGCSRMDKILYCGDVRGVAFERFGAGVVVEGVEGEELERRGEEGVWVTDHYGVRGDFELLGPWELGVRACRGGEGVEGDGLKARLV